LFLSIIFEDGFLQNIYGNLPSDRVLDGPGAMAGGGGGGAMAGCGGGGGSALA